MIFFHFLIDEYNNNDKESLPQDILKLLKSSGGHAGSYGGLGGGHGEPDSASQVCGSKPNQGQMFKQCQKIDVKLA